MCGATQKANLDEGTAGASVEFDPYTSTLIISLNVYWHMRYGWRVPHNIIFMAFREVIIIFIISCLISVICLLHLCPLY